jgi:hypothetical protein
VTGGWGFGVLCIRLRGLFSAMIQQSVHDDIWDSQHGKTREVLLLVITPSHDTTQAKFRYIVYCTVTVSLQNLG